jgi:ubiquinone/menaquinone biosynthesis C-methylase UbiE
MTVTRTRMDFAHLSIGWEAEARQWIQWAPTPGHDSYWRFHRDQFLRLLLPPGRQTLDIGCGEGRLARDLKELGHRIVGIDSSPSLVAAAREFDPSMDVRLADAAALPLDDACADLAVAFMSLQDIDGMPAAIQEAARVLAPGGRFCLAIVHPSRMFSDLRGWRLPVRTASFGITFRVGHPAPLKGSGPAAHPVRQLAN